MLFAASTLQAQTYPDYEDLYVNDYAQILTSAQESQLRLKLQALKAARDIEFTILTIPSMSDYDHSGAIEPFATGLFNTWGIGDADRNDGILLLVAHRDRQMRIELGDGYCTRLDTQMRRIVDNTIIQDFREDAFFTGINEGTNRIIYAATDRYPGEYDANLLTRMFNASMRFIRNFFWWIIGIAAPFGVYYGTKGYFHWKRTKPRYCHNDGSRLYWMTDEDEDAHLKTGQQLEEELGSVDYDVWACRECDDIQVETYPAWFSDYKQCPNCNYRTQYVTKKTVEAATRYATGKGEQTFTCKHCDHSYSKTYVIARLPDPSSSSSSGFSSGGSSSFGGGSSGGGGASGSW